MRRTALDAYIAKKIEIDTMLARLTALSDDLCLLNTTSGNIDDEVRRESAAR